MKPSTLPPARRSFARFTALGRVLGLLSLAALTATAQAQVLLHSIPAPAGGGAQSGARLGYSTATDGAYTVVGVPYDDLLGGDSGVVKVFDSATGALLQVIPNPSPASSDDFGYAVAISGTRVVVGNSLDDTGAENAGSAYVYDLSSGTPTVPVQTLNNPGPAANDYFGISVAISGTRVVVGTPYDDTGVGEAGSAYVYDLGSGTPTVPVQTLNKPGPASGDNFGYSVAISGTRVVVGALNDDTGAADAGSTYVYDLSSGTPTVPVQTLNNPGPAAGDNFGISVAISGTRVVVGAPYDGTGAAEAGSAYVYDLSSGTPTVPVQTLNNPGTAAYDNFGYSVAISGTRVVVGTPWDDTGATNAGSAYVYDLSSGTPTVPVQTLNNPGPASSDNFGWSVAISGTRVVVGTPGDDTGAADAGSAYVYDLSSGTPTVPVQTLNNPGPAANDLFGISVAISGTRVVVGAPYDDAGAVDAGSAYVYDLSSGTPTVPVLTLNNPGPAANDLFGISVAISGTRLVVGAPYDDTGAANAGSAYVYDLSSGTPTVPVLTLNNPGPASGDNFGISVAISGTRLVVGAYQDDTNAANAGSAYVYDLSSGTPTVPVQTLNNPGPASGDNFGISVAISGTRLVVGAYQDDTGAANAGSAYVYDLGSGTPTVPTQTLNKPGAAGNEQFGYAVGISGTRVVVGARGDNTGGLGAGSAYVYDLSSGTPTVPVHTLNNPGPPVGSDQFGYAVGISGTRVVMGTPYDDTGAAEAGSAYVYEVSSGTPTVPVHTLNNPGPASGDNFGYAVAVDGLNTVIGTPLDDSPLADKGRIDIYGPAPAPEIAVSGNSVDIVNGDTTPSVADQTYFGSVAVASGSVWHVFSAANSGTADLNFAAGVNRVTLSGPGASHFDVVTQIPLATVAASGSTSFVIAFDPSAAGLQTATVSIANDDSDENPFTFDISGWGAASSNGTLDTAFSGDGKVTTAPGGTGGDVATCMAVQPDGKTVVAGQSMIGGNLDFSLVRYLADGSLDSSFSGDGIVTTAVGVDHDVALAVAVQPDGKIVVAGYYYNVSNWDSVVVRYLPDGTLDSSFGSGGKAVFALSASGTDVANGVAIQADGKIVLAGETTSGGTVGYVARLTSAGVLDSSFGTGGVTTLTAGGNTRFAAVQLQSDGKIVTTGWRTVGNIDVVLARFTTAGALDSSFDTDGWVTTAVGAGNDMANSLAIQPADGKIVVGGSVQGISSDFMALRYTSAGALDSSFGTGGVVTVDVGGDLDEGTGVALQPDGKIVLGGQAFVGTTYDFAAVRLTTTGTLDTTFDGDGKVITPVGLNQDYANAVVVHPDGGILLAGRSWDLTLGNNDFAVVRYGAASSNSAPTDITLTPSSIAENNAAGATVGTLAAVDADVADSHTFSFATGTGDTDNGSFTITGTDLKLTPVADFETKSSYALRVQANDGNGGTFEKELTVTITNVNEMPSFTKGANQLVIAGSGFSTSQSVPGWATAIDDGDSTVTQGVSFTVTEVGSSGMFSVAPAVSSSGALTYTLNLLSAPGTATFNVTLTDDASINGLPALTTAAQTFTITWDPSIIANDDGDAGYTDTGLALSATAGYSGDQRELTAGGQSARWTFTGLTPNSLYRVSATWQTVPGADTAAIYSVYDGSVAPANRVTQAGLNQGSAPNDFTESGADWEDIDWIRVGASGTLVVTLERTAGITLADAVRVQSRTGPEIQVSTGTSFIFNGGTTTVASTTVSTPSATHFTIKNLGTSTLTLGTVSIGGSNPGDFSVTGTPASSVANGTSTTLQITFNPTAGGLRTATVSFATNDTDETAFTFTIQGNGVVTPEIAVFDGTSPPAGERTDNVGTFGFGSVSTGSSSAAQTFTIQNLGSATADLTGLGVSSTNASEFTFTAPLATTLAPGATTTFTVTFTPSATGARSGVINIASNDANENPFRINVGGTGTLPKVLVCAAATSFGADVRTKLLATGLYSAVDYFDAGSSTPSLTQLQAYNSVFVFRDNSFNNPTLLGNTLADFVDGGGGLVVGVFATNTGSLAGRIQTGGYLPFTNAAQSQGVPLNLVADLPSHALLAGVTSFNGGTSSFHGQISLTAGATQVAHWSNNRPLVIYKQVAARPVVALNFFPPSSTVRSDFWVVTTDGVRLMTNALGYVAGTSAAPTNSAPTDITLTPASIAENNVANATVGTLAAVDADSGQTHTFTLVTGTGDTDNGSFTIVGTALKLTPSANYEVKSSYSLRVQANDGNGGTFAKALTVSITDVYEPPTPVFLGTANNTGGGGGSGVIDAPNATATGSLGNWESIRQGAVLSSNGRIAFRGHMELGTGTPPVTVDDFQGIWKYDGTDTRLKARSGTAAPETGSALYDMLPLNPSISPDGLISFYGTLRMASGSPAVTASINQGLWSEIGGGSPRLLLRKGDTVVGAKTFRSGFAVTTSTVNTAALNAKLSSGTALLHLDVNTPSVLLTVVAEEGQAAPGGGTWIALDGNSSDPRLSANGDLGFIGWELVGSDYIQGIYSRLNSTAVGTSGAVVQARMGGTAPGTGGATFSAFERPTVFNGGMAFRGFLNANGDNAGGTKSQGVWAGAFGALAPVVRTGDTNAQIPTIPVGATVTSVWSPFSNALGSLAMRVGLFDGGGETRAIMGSTGGTMRVIAKVDNAAPGLPGEVFTNFDHPVIGDGDQIAFSASTDAGSYGIWKEAPGGGALGLVMKVGDTINTSEGNKVVSEISLPGATSDDRKFEARCMDATGRLLIHVTFADGTTSLLLGQ